MIARTAKDFQIQFFSQNHEVFEMGCSSYTALLNKTRPVGLRPFAHNMVTTIRATSVFYCRLLSPLEENNCQKSSDQQSYLFFCCRFGASLLATLVEEQVLDPRAYQLDSVVEHWPHVANLVKLHFATAAFALRLSIFPALFGKLIICVK